MFNEFALVNYLKILYNIINKPKETAMKKKKRSSKNLKISTRITLTTVLAIVIPIVIVTVFSIVFLSTLASTFNVSSVTTNSYSMLNQLQWNQAISSISNELISSDDTSEKLSKIDKFVGPIEKLGSKIYIGYNDEEFYSTSSKKDIISSANAIVQINTDENMNYFAENGIVIINHAEVDGGTYLVLITNDDYTVNNVSSHYNAQNFSSIIFGKTGLIILMIILVFVISIVIVSLITASTIVSPLKKLSTGANEIANGNLDYIIDYNSTNEIGETVTAFNNMTQQLKISIYEQRKLEQSRKEMIAGLAHDIRTPLTSIRGYIEGLLDGIAKTPEMQERYLKTIYSSTGVIEKLSDELMTVSQLELGKININSTPIKITEFLDDCADEISASLEKLGFDFVYTSNCEQKTVCNIDADNFSRVIRNIVSNSIKYAKKDIRGRVELAVEEYQKSVIITISDNGIGLDAQSLPKIFDSFYRADKARSNVRDGSGIGLSVCKQIVELHGGHIWASSKENEGLTIHISLFKEL